VASIKKLAVSIADLGLLIGEFKTKNSTAHGAK
jgi:hypothetical protein